MQMNWIHFPLWEGPDPLGAWIQCCGIDCKCPQIFMCWTVLSVQKYYWSLPAVGVT
jgi:hypothetical protein